MSDVQDFDTRSPRQNADDLDSIDVDALMKEQFSSLLKVLTAGCLAGAALVAVRIAQLGINPKLALLEVLLLSMAVVFFVIRNNAGRAPAYIVVVSIALAGMVGISNMGLASAGTVTLIVPPLLASIFLKPRDAAFVVIAEIVGFGLIGAGLPILRQDHKLSAAELNSTPENWLIVGAALLLIVSLIALVLHNLQNSWKTSVSIANALLRQNKELIESAPEAITVIDVDTGLYRRVNRAAERLLGFPRNEMIGKKAPWDVSPDRQPNGEVSRQCGKGMLLAAERGENVCFEWVHLDADNTPVECEIRLAKMPSAGRSLIRASVVDISARKRAERKQAELANQLAASQRFEAIGSLTGGMAHDFNNLLAVIMGNLELAREAATSERQRELIDAGLGATERGANLTRSMLSFAGRAEFKMKTVKLNDLVSEAKTWIGRTLPENIDLETSLQVNLWNIRVDPGATENAILNLILNARDAMPDGGRLTLETANISIGEETTDARGEDLETGQYVMLAVGDTGQGIPEDLQQRVFDPFFTTKPPGSGSGIGLSMVQGFVKQSGGVIQVHSEPDIGTTVRLYFKAVYGPADAPSRISDMTRCTAQAGKRILVVEDEPTVLAVLVAGLKKAGYAVTQAATGDEALDAFKSDPTFDALLTDIVMPGRLQGTDLARALREINPDVPVVFMSGYAREALTHGNGLHPNDIRLMKPVRMSDLVQALETVLGQSDVQD